jgi:hypothetical protein
VGAERYEHTTAADPALNYCLWEYSRTVPAEDKFRSVNLLFRSFEQAAIDGRAYDIVDAIREGVGPFRTVFGVKLLNERLAWEFYFYDYKRREREVSMSRVLAAIAPFARSSVRPNENLPYFMFSLDIDDELVTGRRDMDVVHMYVGNPGSTVSSGIAYALREHSTTLENFYFFFDAATQLDEAADKIACSAHYDSTRVPMDQILVPQLRKCQTICVANKQTHDCVYFSGIDVEQLLYFLDRLGYPQPLVSFVRENRGNLDHLLFDVGIDYRVENGHLQALKSGYYGVF